MLKTINADLQIINNYLQRCLGLSSCFIWVGISANRATETPPLASSPPSCYLPRSKCPATHDNQQKRASARGREGQTQAAKRQGPLLLQWSRGGPSCSRPPDSPVPLLPRPSLVRWPCPVSPTGLVLELTPPCLAPGSLPGLPHRTP